MQQTQVMRQKPAQSGSNQPEKRFSTGAISATVWKNNTVSKTGEQVTFRTISLQRGYKDKDDSWKNTTTLRVQDIPRATLVLQKAYEYLSLKDGDSSMGEAY